VSRAVLDKFDNLVGGLSLTVCCHPDYCNRSAKAQSMWDKWHGPIDSDLILLRVQRRSFIVARVRDLTV
jgi:hypothetical protein